MNRILKCFVILFCSAAAVLPCSVAEKHQQENCTSSNCLDFSFSEKPELLRKDGYHVLVHNMDCKCDLEIAAGRRRDDYHYTPGVGAHKFHTRGTTFNAARKICHQEGGHLVIIDCEEEAKIITDLAKRAGLVKNAAKKHDGQGWIGIHDLFAEGEWVTIFGNPLHQHGYNKWTDLNGGQPDNTGGIEHCGSFLYGHAAGGMNDLACNITQPFFCEIPEVEIL